MISWSMPASEEPWRQFMRDPHSYFRHLFAG
jgi:hypothetical protein